MSSIEKEEALEHISYYRDDIEPGSLKSVWIDGAFIRFILEKSESDHINGVRVYLAKYKKGVGNVPAGMEDKMTTILAATVTGDTEGGKDHEEGCFNYGDPCPPSCDDDEGRKN